MYLIISENTENFKIYRKKYRIRIYNDNDSFIRLEKKMKHNNYTAKEQMLISKDIYCKIVNGKINEIDGAEGLLLEFINECRTKKLIPSISRKYAPQVFLRNCIESQNWANCSNR